MNRAQSIKSLLGKCLSQGLGVIDPIDESGIGTMRKNPNLENIGDTAIRMRRRAVIAKSSYTVNQTPSTRPSGVRTTLLTTSEVINFRLVLRQERI